MGSTLGPMRNPPGKHLQIFGSGQQKDQLQLEPRLPKARQRQAVVLPTTKTYHFYLGLCHQNLEKMVLVVNARRTCSTRDAVQILYNSYNSVKVRGGNGSSRLEASSPSRQQGPKSIVRLSVRHLQLHRLVGGPSPITLAFHGPAIWAGAHQVLRCAQIPPSASKGVSAEGLEPIATELPKRNYARHALMLTNHTPGNQPHVLVVGVAIIFVAVGVAIIFVAVGVAIIFVAVAVTLINIS